MVDDSKKGPASTKGLGRGLTLAIVGAVVVAGAAVLYVMAGAAFKPASSDALRPLAKGPMAKLYDSRPAPPPAAGFVDAEGKTVRIADLKGEVLVVNLWATWCAPCVKEMPTLAALQKAYEGQPVKVLAISIDKEDQTAAAKAFMAQNAPLGFYQEASLMLPYSFDPYVQGFPTTVLYDKSGQERARLVGEADWSTDEAKAVIDHLLALE